MDKSKIIGVCLLLFSDDGRIITIQELESKLEFHKKAGMVSFPIETFEEWRDASLLHTIYRLLREELGISHNEVSIEGIAPEHFNFIPERDDIIWYYGFGIFLGNPNRKFIPEDTDIRVVGWKTLDQLMAEKSKRIEVDPIINHYRKQKFV